MLFKKFNFKKEYIHCVPDESLIGKCVLCGDTYKKIIEQVESNNWPSYRRVLVEIDESVDICPFGINDTGIIKDRIRYCPFVYYDPEWDKEDEKTVYYCYLDKDGKRSCFSYTSKKPDTHIYVEFIRVGDALDWCYNHGKFAEIAKAWEDGKTIQFRTLYPSLFNEEWLDCPNNQPSWDLNTEYRVKPNEPVEVETSEGKMYLANGAEIPKKRRMTNRELAKWLAQGNGECRFNSGIRSTTYTYTHDNEPVTDKNVTIRGWNEEEWHEPEVEVSV